MTVWQSAALGAVQGITEFLPVSSSGHLAILKNLFAIDTGGDLFFEVMLHLATVLVILAVFREDVVFLFRAAAGMAADVFRNLTAGRKRGTDGAPAAKKPVVSNNYRKFALQIVISTIPTAVMGFFFRNLVEDASGELLIPGICLAVTGVLLLLADRAPAGDKIPADVTYREALIIGIAQSFALLPGLSRCGVTISVCLLLGLDRRYAVKYSFLMAVPAILGAVILEAASFSFSSYSWRDAGICLAGMAAAALVGYLCIRFLLVIIKNRRFLFFACYCIAAGVLATGAYVLEGR